ncbi:MAG TPA: hypothetical protein VMU84_02040 [Thermoanaerobaculia bacterium]|nr:hypothetical protein [Thermoanaerobaculia bacterium]
MTLALRWLSMRYATGLRTAMSAWTPLLIAAVAAAGLEVKIDVRSYIRAWDAAPASTRMLILLGATIVIVAATRRILRSALHGEGSELLKVLPIAAHTRFGLDVLAVLIFLIPLIIVSVVIIGAWTVPLMLASAMIIVLWQPATGNRQRHSNYELHWFANRRLLATSIGALLAIGAAKLAIMNNSVHSPSAFARIASLFAALGAMFIAFETGHLDAEARPWRRLERSLPRTALASLVRTTAIATLFALPVALVALALSPVAALLAIVAHAMLFLLARLESQGAVAWAGSFAALIAAFQPLVVIVAMVIAMVILARALEARERTCDA